jgi:alkylation response protein AidB-like acyl-CoA dehydrogenase
MSVNNLWLCRDEKYCNEEQKMKYLVPLAKGEVIGFFVIRARSGCNFSKNNSD